MIDLKKVQELTYALLTIVAAHDKDQEKKLGIHLQEIDNFEFKSDLSTLKTILLNMPVKEDDPLFFLNTTARSLIALMQAKDTPKDALEKEINTFFSNLSQLFQTQENTLCSLESKEKSYLTSGLLIKPRFFFQTPTPNFLGQTIIQTFRTQCSLQLQNESQTLQFNIETLTAHFFIPTSLRLPIDTLSLETQAASPTTSLGTLIASESSSAKSEVSFAGVPQNSSISLEGDSPTTQNSHDLIELLESPAPPPKKERPSLFFIKNDSASIGEWPQHWPLEEQPSSIPIVNNYGNLVLARIQ